MIIKTPNLLESDLSDLFNNNILGTHINDYISQEICNKLIEFINARKNKIEKYDHDEKINGLIVNQYYGIERLGYPYNKTFGKSLDSKEFENYYSCAKSFMKDIRSSMMPYISPIDKVRLDLDEAWGYGANISNIDGKKMYAGIIRVSDTKLSYLSEENPHIDYLVSDKVAYKGQFSAIIYIKTPKVGGELQIWGSNERLNFDNEWIESQPSPYTVKPSACDLLIINTNKPHAIKRFSDGERIAIQCFIGIKEDNSLSLWS